ncbi:hypothetical protein F4810DRAFT_673814 [Camillea tinctor]|nr:hypothetical protein F4810DRAFT_673814 [Camillea tinctor]
MSLMWIYKDEVRPPGKQILYYHHQQELLQHSYIPLTNTIPITSPFENTHQPTISISPPSHSSKMKSTTAALCLISATLSLAAPASNKRDISNPLGFAVPSILKIHDITSNQNTPAWQTSTVRSGGFETSTLYDIPIPAAAQGRTCGLVFRAGRVGAGDAVQGEQALDVFRNGFTDLASLTEGNLREAQLARIRFDAATGLYAFDETAIAPAIREFPCPTGTLHWEAAAVGELDVNVVQQDFSYDGTNVPNGISVAWW